MVGSVDGVGVLRGCSAVQLRAGRFGTLDVFPHGTARRTMSAHADTPKEDPPGGGRISGTRETSRMSSRRVLVIDDESDLRRAVREMLRVLGYSSIGAAGGAEGLDIFRQQADTVGLILLDAHMPGLEGVEMLRRIRETAPDVPVVFITGDPGGIRPQDREGPGSVEILGKPLQGRKGRGERIYR